MGGHRCFLGLLRRGLWLPSVLLVVLLLAVVLDRMLIVDERIRDAAFRLRGVRALGSDLVIVAIDDDSLARLGMKWPWPRSVYADLLTRLAEAGVRVCGFDLLFTEPDQNDEQFASAIRRGNMPVVLASKLSHQQRVEYSSIRYMRPVPVLEEAADGVGYVNLPLDADGVVRRVPQWTQFGELQVRSFTQSILSFCYPNGEAVSSVDYLINFVGGPTSIPTVSFYQVLEGLVPSEQLKAKIVLVGITADDLGDRYLTPFASEGLMPGVEVHANVLDSALQGEYLHRASPLLESAANISFGVIAALCVRCLPGWSGFPLCMILIAAVYWISSILLRIGVAISVFPSVFTGITIPTVMYGHRFLTVDRQRRRLRGLFSRYLPGDLREGIARGSEDGVTPRRCDASVLFCDVRGFTSVANRLSPEETISFLNSLLEHMTGAVEEHRGIVMKLMGDGFMAVFGISSEDEGHPQRAVDAALEINRRVRSVRIPASEPDESVRVGIGVHSGEVAIGDVGSNTLVDHTVVGSTVNIASRLEGLTKQLETSIIVSEDTHKQLNPSTKTQFRRVPRVGVRGLPIELTVYALSDAQVARNGSGGTKTK